MLQTVTVKCPHCSKEVIIDLPLAQPEQDPRPKDVRLLAEILSIFRQYNEMREALGPLAIPILPQSQGPDFGVDYQWVKQRAEAAIKALKDTGAL